LAHHFYDHTLLYRIVPNFVQQFEKIDTAVTKKWEQFKVSDEPVIKRNLKVFVCIARSAKNTRGNDLFIYLKDG
jgi:peptidyl-prolyl cis-trans isomerase A (cyclophilin A)